MRIIIQRVSSASCTVENKVTGQIAQGFMVLVGFGLNDSRETVRKLAEKTARLRIFSDEEGKINRSLKDVGGKILSISQFTLYGDCRKGNRPSFVNALGGREAEEMYDYYNECLVQEGIPVETGIFGADMKIELVNDGPVTIMMDSEEMLHG